MRRMVWPRRPHGSGVTVGVTAGVTRNVTPTEGGMLHQQQEGCYIPLFHLSPPLFGFFVLDRLTRAAPAEREKTGATPPFLPLVRHGEGGGCYTRCYIGCNIPPAAGGSLPSL